MLSLTPCQPCPPSTPSPWQEKERLPVRPHTASPYLSHTHTVRYTPCPISRLPCHDLLGRAGIGISLGLSLDPQHGKCEAIRQQAVSESPHHRANLSALQGGTANLIRFLLQRRTNWSPGVHGVSFREVLYGVKFQSGCCRRQGEPEAEDAYGEDLLFGQVQVFRESVSVGEHSLPHSEDAAGCMAAPLGWRQGKQGGPSSELALER